MIKGMRILVTGSDGFIGRRLVRQLKEKGGRIFCADRKRGVEIAGTRSLDRFRGIDIVFHLAAVSRDLNERRIFLNNVIATINVLEFCRRNSSKLVFLSSFVYGRPRYLPVDEGHPQDPKTAYAYSKFVGEALCGAYNRVFGTRVVILRPFNIYGAGQTGDFVIPTIIKKVKRSASITLKGRNEKRDFLYIDDMTEACVKGALYDKKDFDVFNIGSGKSFSIGSVVSAVAKYCGRGAVRVRYLGDARYGVIPDTVADIKKAKRLLHWHPRVSFKSGIRRSISG